MGYCILFGLLLSPLLAMGTTYFQRPAQKPLNATLFEGIRYERSFRSSPRPMVIHIVSLNLKASGLQAFVTPPLPENPEHFHNEAQTTTSFLKKYRLQLAINGSFFYQFREETPWNYFPQRGDRVWVLGTTISDRKPYVETQPGFPSICFTSQKTAQIIDGICPLNTVQAISGNEIFIKQGQPIQKPSAKARDWLTPYPRTAIALDKSGQRLWLIVVDGKQPFYSEGISMPELGAIAKDLGAETALNLDGGGSVTLVMDHSGTAKVLNSPIQTKIPTLERPIANHLGFYARGKISIASPKE